MTPNQVEGIGRAVAELLAEAHQGGAVPSAFAAKVRRQFGHSSETWRVEAYTLDEDGAIILGALVPESGEVRRLDSQRAGGISQRSDCGTSETSDETRPGVRVGEDGEAQYSSDFLNDRQARKLDNHEPA